MAKLFSIFGLCLEFQRLSDAFNLRDHAVVHALCALKYFFIWTPV